jgi:hypothetical protein
MIARRTQKLLIVTLACVVTFVASRGLQDIEQTLDIQDDVPLQAILGYTPQTQVTDHAALDLDQQQVVELMDERNVIEARNIYSLGGHSGSYALLTVHIAAANATNPVFFPILSEITGTSRSGHPVYGFIPLDLLFNVTGDVQIPVEYVTYNNQPTYVDCQVGGLFTASVANRDGCKLTFVARLISVVELFV